MFFRFEEVTKFQVVRNGHEVEGATFETQEVFVPKSSIVRLDPVEMHEDIEMQAFMVTFNDGSKIRVTLNIQQSDNLSELLQVQPVELVA